MSDWFATPWTVARLAPLSVGFPRQEYSSGLPFPSPGELPNPGIEPVSPGLAGGFFTTEPPGRSLETSLFADDVVLYIENHDTIRKLLELISELAKLQDKKSIHRNHLPSYILTMKNQKEKSRNQFHSSLQQKE